MSTQIPDARFEDPRYLLPKIKPENKPVVDANNPISRDIASTVLFNTDPNNTIDVVLGRPISATHQGVTLKSGQYWSIGSSSADGFYSPDIAKKVDEKTEFSIFVKLKNPVNTGALRYVYAKGNSGATSLKLLIWFQGNNSWRSRVDYSGGSSALNFGDSSAKTLAVTAGDGYHKVYQDGVLKNSDVRTGAFAVTDQDFYIGRNLSTGSPYAGDLDCIMLWYRALSLKEVASLHINPYQIFVPA